MIFFKLHCIIVLVIEKKQVVLHISWVKGGAQLNKKMGCSQAVRHKTLTLACVGSNPATPAMRDSLAQLEEHLTFNQGVPGSSPGWITIFFAKNWLYFIFLLKNKKTHNFLKIIILFPLFQKTLKYKKTQKTLKIKKIVEK